MPKPGLEFFDPTGTPMQNIGNICGHSEQILPLYKGSGDYTRLLHFAAWHRQFYHGPSNS